MLQEKKYKLPVSFGDIALTPLNLGVFHGCSKVAIVVLFPFWPANVALSYAKLLHC